MEIISTENFSLFIFPPFPIPQPNKKPLIPFSITFLFILYPRKNHPPNSSIYSIKESLFPFFFSAPDILQGLKTESYPEKINSILFVFPVICQGVARQT